jgi:hypothetical protein
MIEEIDNEDADGDSDRDGGGKRFPAMVTRDPIPDQPIYDANDSEAGDDGGPGGETAGEGLLLLGPSRVECAGGGGDLAGGVLLL